jgi:hypothetical protein
MPWNMDAMSFNCGFGGCPGCCWKLFKTSCAYTLATVLTDLQHYSQAAAFGILHREPCPDYASTS